MPRARITICIDDLGLHEGVGAAAARLIELERVDAIGCMTTTPGWSAQEARALQAASSGRVDFGLHLDLTEAAPAGAASTGWRVPLRTLIGRALLRRLDPHVIRAQIEAQLDAFEDGLSRPPDFIDGHQHVHQLPQVREALAAALRARYGGNEGNRALSIVPWIRSTRRAGTVSGSPALALKSSVIAALGDRAMGRIAEELGAPRNGRLLGVYGFDGDETRLVSLWEGWLGSARDGDLLMCHPAIRPAGALKHPDPILDARVREFAWMCSDQWDAMMRRCGVGHGRFGHEKFGHEGLAHGNLGPGEIGR